MSEPVRSGLDEGRSAGESGSRRCARVERRCDEEGSLRHNESDRLDGGFGNQGDGHIEPRARNDQAFVMKRGRVDLIVLIPLPRGRMMTLMSMLLPIGASFPVLVLVRQSVQQRHAGREKVRGERGDHN